MSLKPLQTPIAERRLTNAMSFLPVARSSASLDYFVAITKDPLEDRRTRIVAMDLGLKDTLFNEYLLADASSLGLSGLLILLCILLYTQSFFLTVATGLAILFGLSLAYALYTFVVGVEFFPFMNVLAVVIAVGVGADDSFIMVKAWTSMKADPNLGPDEQMDKMVADTLRHSWMSMLVTSLTTAIAFFASYISSITAIKCFSLFAGFAIFCNFLLMLTWIPAALVFYQRYCHATCCCCLRSHTIAADGSDIESLDSCMLGQILCSARTSITSCCRTFFQKILPALVIKGRVLWLFSIGVLIAYSMVAVFYYPGLKLPDQDQFQLFREEHTFERYDLRYKSHFGFERDEKRDVSLHMPLRFVWGLTPADHGDYLNPGRKGGIQVDETFDIATSDAQRWMLKFCEDIRKQSFFSPTMGPLLSNCFLQTFKEWMDRRCKDELSGIDRAPCCQASKFPYTRSIFERCLLQAVEDLYETPTDLWIPGVAGPKFNITTNLPQVVIVEYDAKQIFSFSHAEMSAFYNEVNTWFSDVISTAPPELKGGFFVSHLEFFDVQNSLSRDTMSAIALAMSIAVVVLFACTLNVAISLVAVCTVCGVISVSVGVLVVLGWRLNILESVAITLTIGLSVDFTLHYAIMFKHALASGDSGQASVTYALTNMAAPVSMAALTTLIAGICLLPTRVLAYTQIGTFIVIVMSASWLISTFFFMSVLSVCGSRMFCSPDLSRLLPKKVRDHCHELWESGKTRFASTNSETQSLDKAATTFRRSTRITFEIPEAADSDDANDLAEQLPVQPEAPPAMSFVSHPNTFIQAQNNRLLSKSPEQQILTLGYTFVGDRSAVSTVDVHSLPCAKEDSNGVRKELPVSYESLPECETTPPNSTLPLQESKIEMRREKKFSTSNHRCSNKSLDSLQQPQWSEVVETAIIHCDSPTIRADIEYHTQRRPPPMQMMMQQNHVVIGENGCPKKDRKFSLAVAQQAPVIVKKRSRQKSLPFNSLEADKPKNEVALVEPLVIRKEPLTRKQSTPKTFEEEAQKVKDVVNHRRKNSYKKAQEKELLQWYEMPERRKSSGNLEEEQRRQNATAYRPRTRNSSSMGDILANTGEDNRVSSYVKHQQQTPAAAAVQVRKAANRSGSSKLRSSYHYERHPLSHSTTTILDANANDPHPIVPNKCSATPDVWLPRAMKA